MSGQVSTIKSTATAASGGVSTADSRVTTTSAGVSSNTSFLTVMSGSVSTLDSRMVVDRARGLQQSTADSASPTTSGTIFTYTGAIELVKIIGTVESDIQDQATTVKLQANPDGLGAGDLCDTVDLNDATAGSLLEITGTAAGAMVKTAAGFLAPATQINPIVPGETPDPLDSVPHRRTIPHPTGHAGQTNATGVHQTEGQIADCPPLTLAK